MSKPSVCGWGIIGCGSISGKFVRDLALDPAGRNVSDVSHAVVAVGSRDVKKAQAFIDENAPRGGSAQQAGLYEKSAKACGSYAEVYNDPDVQIVYVGTPHTHHFEVARDAISAGKGVLVEKPATLNASESKVLIDLAKEKNVFFMEAVWTRFFPLVYRFQELLHKEKAIGDIHHVLCDFGFGFYHTKPVEDRLFAAELAGGAQLDLGPYSILWGLLALHEHPDNERSPPSKITASSLKDPRTGVDLFTSITLDFAKITARADLTCNAVVSTPSDACVRVIGTEGELLVGTNIAARPECLTLRKYKGARPIRQGGNSYEETREEFAIQGTGLHWEADAVARLLRDGKKTSDRCPPEVTLLSMRIMDEWRKQSGYVYPEGLEKA